MTYIPTKEDLELLTNRSKDLYCRIDLLDSNYCVVDSLEGLAMSGSISIDADSDTRRTFNVDIHPKKGTDISEYEVEDWMDKMIRVYVGIKSPVSKLQAEGKVIDVDAYNDKLNALNAYTAALDVKIQQESEYITSLAYQQKVIKRLTDEGYATYGNIDNINRPVIYWTDDIAAMYKPFLKEHTEIDTGPEEYSTVVGCDDQYSNFQIAYASLVVNNGALVPLTDSVLINYIEKTVEAASKMSGGLTPANILAADKKGRTGYYYLYNSQNKNEIWIHDMIAAVEGQTIKGVKLNRVDVCAIAGWSEAELKKEFNQTSVFVGHSMHDIQEEVIEADKEADKVYDKLWEQMADQKILTENAETVSSCYVDVDGVHWYNKGVFVIKENGITYNATTNTLSLSCSDLTALLDGTFGGNLTGFQTIIYRYKQTADKKDDMTRPQKIRQCVVDTFKLSGLTKYNIDYWERFIPHDMEYNAGTTIWQILTELRDLYYPFEMYFDDDTFVCKEIPSGINDPVVLDEDTFANLVISEDASVDYSQVKNCVEVFGATIDSDMYAYKSSKDEDGQSVDNYVELITDSTTLDEMYKELGAIWKRTFIGTRPKQAMRFHFKDQDFLNSSSISISFTCPATVKIDKDNDMFFEIINEYAKDPTKDDTDNTTTTESYVNKIGIRHLYKSATDKYGNDQLTDDGFTLIAGRYYVFKLEPTIIANTSSVTESNNGTLADAMKEYYDNLSLSTEKGTLDDEGNVIYKENRFYFMGQQQSHAMVKFVDKVPTEAMQKVEREKEGCDNLEWIAVTDPTDFSGSYNSRMTIDKIGRRNEILAGGEYDNYTTDERSMEVSKYKLWQGTRLTDTVQLQMLLVPWLDVNERIDYAARYMKNKAAVEWLVKKIDFNLGEGTMNVTMSRYYPYYPYIVKGKYDEDYIS